MNSITPLWPNPKAPPDPSSLLPEPDQPQSPDDADLQDEPEIKIDYATLLAGKIMVESTKQLTWILYLRGGLGAYYRQREDVLIAGDLAWLPDPKRSQWLLAPDIMVVYGRPRHDRTSYKQWQEGNIPPQVVFEILSPSNTPAEMEQKRGFYERYGVEEYYEFDPYQPLLTGYIRSTDERLTAIEEMVGWTSPRMGLTFRLEGEGFRLYRPDGLAILTHEETEAAREEAEAAREEAEAARLAEQEARQQAEAAKKQAEITRLAEQEARQQAEAARLAAQEARQQAEALVQELQQQLAALQKKIP